MSWRASAYPTLGDLLVLADGHGVQSPALSARERLKQHLCAAREIAVKVFISGTTVDFEAQRRQLRDVLCSLTQIHLEPIVQETLNEDTAPDANTVRKIINNVSRCDLVFCLVGFAGGYPQQEVERRTVRELAERYLHDQLNVIELGDFWHQWGDRGMTYTQLEAFLALSVFKRRTRVYHTNWPSDDDDVDDHQRPYLAFLRDTKHTIDRSPLDDWKVDALKLAVEFALQRRGATEPIPGDIPAREAIRQRFGVVRDEATRSCLRIDSFDAFYHEVLGRLTEPVPVLERYWPREPLGANRVVGRPALVVNEGSNIAMAVRCASNIVVMRYDLATGTVTTKRRHQVDHSSYPISMAPDGEALLVMSGPAAQLLIGSDPPRHVEVPPLDVFSEYPALVKADGHIWLTIKQTDGSTDWRCLTQLGEANHPAEQDACFPKVLFFETGTVEVEHPKTRGSLTLPIPQPALMARPGQAFLLRADEEAPLVESIELRQYGSVNVMDLFLIAESVVETGHFVQMKIERANDKLVWAIEYNRAEGQQAEERIELSEAPTGVPVPTILNPIGAMSGQHGTIKQPKRSPATHRVTLPFSAKYSWTSNGEFLLAVTSTSGFVARAWRFPRPLEEGEFVKGFWELLNGRKAFDAENAMRWKASLKSHRPLPSS